MRLLHVLTVPLTLRFLRGQVDFVAQHGFDVHVACAPGEKLQEFSRAHPVTPHGIELTRTVSPAADLRSLAEMRALIRRLRPDVVHAHTPKGGLIGMMAAASERVPRRIYHLRGLPLITARGVMRKVLWTTESISFSCAHRVLAVSSSLARAAEDAGILGSSKSKVLAGGSGNGVDARGRFDPTRAPSSEAARAKFGLPGDRVVVTYVGRLVRDKGIAELLAAWESIASRGDVVLFVVGPFEDRDALPAELVRRITSSTSIHHLEFTEDMPTVYAASDVVVLPSHREGFPNVPLEAASMGLPVVTTDAVGCVDAVVDGRTGRVCALGDVEALERAITSYLDSPETRRSHGAAGRQRALVDFDPQRIWRELLDEYVA